MSFMMRRGIVSSGALSGIVPFAANSSNLNGTTQYFDAGNPTELQITGDLTIACWVKLTSITSSQIIFSKHKASNRSYQLIYSSGNKFRFDISDDGTTELSAVTSSAIIAGTWHFIAGRYNGSTAELFLDGLPETSLPHSTGIFNGTAKVFIGARDFVGFEDHMTGSIAMNYISNTVLSNAQILSMHEATATTRCFADLDPAIQSASVYAPRLANWGTNAGDELVDQSASGITTNNIASTPFTGTGLTVECSS